MVNPQKYPQGLLSNFRLHVTPSSPHTQASSEQMETILFLQSEVHEHLV